MDLMIRAATLNDIQPLAAFARHMFAHNFGYLYKPENLAMHLEATCSENFFRHALAQGDTVLLAFDGETLIGYTKAGVIGLPVENVPAGAAEIHRFYLLDAYHGRGVASALMERALSLPVLSDAPIVYVGVWEHNHRAQKFYARYGFAVVGRYLYRVADQSDQEIIMARPADRHCAAA